MWCKKNLFKLIIKKNFGIFLHSDFLNKIVQNSAPPIWNKIVQNSIRDRDRDRSDKSRDWDVHFGSLLFKDLSYLRPCLKLNLPRCRFAAPAAPRACNATRPVRVHRSLRSHLLYWNTTRDQSEGLFRGLTSNPKYTALSKVGPLLLKNFSSIL